MKALFIDILELCITTGVLIILWMPIQKIWGSSLRASTKYIIWSVILLRLLFPVESSISLIKYYKEVPVGIVSQSAVSSTETDIFGILCTVWITIAVILLLFRSLVYLCFVIQIHKSSTKVCCIDSRIPTFLSDKVTTPCLCGLIFSKIILPYIPENAKETKLMIEHEQCHKRRLDLWVKLIDNFVKCIYWFNPFVYLLSSQITLFMEMSCDESVLSGKGKDERILYAEMMLRVMKGQTSSVYVPLTTGFSYGFSHVKQRFSVILSDGKKRTALIAVIIVIILAILCGTLFGVSVVEVEPEIQKDTALNALYTSNQIIEEEGLENHLTASESSIDTVTDIFTDTDIRTETDTAAVTDQITLEEETTLTVIESKPAVTTADTTVFTDTQTTVLTTEADTTKNSESNTEFDDTVSNTTVEGPVMPGSPPAPPGSVYVDILFDVNGGDDLLSSDAVNDGRYEVGKPMGYLPIPRRSGYIFDGWWTLDENGNYSVLYTKDSIVTQRCVLVAKWIEI